MAKIDSRIEAIFAHAAALDQSGRLRNTIYIKEKDVYILNKDHSVLLHFLIPSSVSPFHSPISFNASDYDSSSFQEENGKVVFVQNSNGMIRKKICSVPGYTPDDIETIFKNNKPLKEAKTILTKDIIGLLDENLSHIEMKSDKKEGSVVVIQRNIYDGTVIEIRREKQKGFGTIQNDFFDKDFGPVGMRTNDFIALFAFNDQVTFTFGEKEKYCRVKGINFKMTGIIGLCAYDELGKISYLEEVEDGGQKQKGRRGKSSANRKA